MATVSDVRRRLSSTAKWMMTLEDGLNGKPHSLGLGKADAFEKALAKLGIEFLSRTKASKQGLELRRGAKPVVRRYYRAPISDWKDLYVAEQFRPAVAPPHSNSTQKSG
jgi:hypothetical protein